MHLQRWYKCKLFSVQCVNGELVTSACTRADRLALIWFCISKSSLNMFRHIFKVDVELLTEYMVSFLSLYIIDMVCWIVCVGECLILFGLALGCESKDSFFQCLDVSVVLSFIAILTLPLFLHYTCHF